MFKLIFDGPVDDSPDTLRKLKGALLGDLGLSVDEAQAILGQTPAVVKTSTQVEDLKSAQHILKSAGAKVMIVKPKHASAEAALKEIESAEESVLEVEADLADPAEELIFDLEELTSEGKKQSAKEPKVYDLSAEFENTDAADVLQNLVGAEDEPIFSSEVLAKNQAQAADFTPSHLPNLDLEAKSEDVLFSAPPATDKIAANFEEPKGSPTPPQSLEGFGDLTLQPFNQESLPELYETTIGPNKAELAEQESLNALLEPEPQASSTPEPEPEAPQPEKPLALEDQSPEKPTANWTPPGTPVSKTDPSVKKFQMESTGLELDSDSNTPTPNRPQALPPLPPPSVTPKPSFPPMSSIELSIDEAPSSKAIPPPSAPKIEPKPSQISASKIELSLDQAEAQASIPVPASPAKPAPSTKPEPNLASPPPVQAKSEPPPIPKASAPAVSKAEVEVDVEVDVQVSPAQTKKRSSPRIPIDMIGPIIIGSALLGFGNWFYFTNNQELPPEVAEQFAEAEAELKAITDKLVASRNDEIRQSERQKPESAPVAEGLKYLSGSVSAPEVSLNWEFELLENELTLKSASLSTQKPKPLTPEEIVQGKTAPPWIHRIEFSQIPFIRSTADPLIWQAQTPVRVYIEHLNQRLRKVGEAKIELSLDTQAQKLSGTLTVSAGDHGAEQRIIPELQSDGNYRFYIVSSFASN